MQGMQTCPSCHQLLPEINRFSSSSPVQSQAPTPPPTTPEQLNLNVLYGMVGTLILAVLLPPWETPPSQPPEFLGFHSVLSPPTPEAIISRMLLTIELTTVTIAGLYAAFYFRRRP